jgi:hypothetical protein
VSPNFSSFSKLVPPRGALIAELLDKNSSHCPVAASLTDADRATLLSIKQEIESVEATGLANRHFGDID